LSAFQTGKKQEDSKHKDHLTSIHVVDSKPNCIPGFISLECLLSHHIPKTDHLW